MSVLLEQPDPEAPDRPVELMAKIKALDPASPIIAELAAALASPRGVKKPDVLSEPAEERPTVQVQQADVSLPVDLPSEAPSMVTAPALEPGALRLAEGTIDGSVSASNTPPLPQVVPVIETEEVTAVAKEPETADSEALRFVDQASPPVLPDPSITSDVGAAQTQAAPAQPVHEGTSLSDHAPLRQAPPQVTEHEYRVHYELGMAYKNMGMLDEAIEEFRVAINGRDCFVDASTLLAESLKEKGLAEPAMECLEQALADDRCDEAKAIPIRYELGMRYESDGWLEKAAMMFSSIPTFLDVPMRLERLKRAQASHSSHPSEGESPSGEPTAVAAANAPSGERKKRRISYL
jgi:tetratricopeptide (TPR) repeat protein